MDSQGVDGQLSNVLSGLLYPQLAGWVYCFACLVPRSVQRFSFQPDFDGVQSDFLSLTGWLSGLGIADGFTVEDQDLG